MKGQSFLQRFQGKTTKMGKSGITGLLQQVNLREDQTVVVTADQQKKRPSRYRKIPSQSQQSPRPLNYEVNLDTLIPSNPKPTHIATVKQRSQKVKPNKSDLVPSQVKYIPSFGLDSSRAGKIKTIEQKNRRQELYNPPRTIDKQYKKQRKYEQTRRTSLSEKNNHEKSLVSGYHTGVATKPLKMFGMSEQIQDDVIKHLDFLSLVEKRLHLKQ